MTALTTISEFIYQVVKLGNHGVILDIMDLSDDGFYEDLYAMGILDICPELDKILVVNKQ